MFLQNYLWSIAVWSDIVVVLIEIEAAFKHSSWQNGEIGAKLLLCCACFRPRLANFTSRNFVDHVQSCIYESALHLSKTSKMAPEWCDVTYLPWWGFPRQTGWAGGFSAFEWWRWSRESRWSRHDRDLAPWTPAERVPRACPAIHNATHHLVSSHSK